MADVKLTPRVRCDNCGATADKVHRDKLPPSDWVRPREWGSMKAEGGRICQQTYGTGKERLDFTDLCPRCAEAAFNAAAEALIKTRSEGFDGPTGAE
jgi:hypothetical protein